MFLFSHFYDRLPLMLQEFKMIVRSHFPIIYDTMLLFSDEKIQKLIPEKQSSALAAIYKFLKKSSKMEKIKIEFGMPDGKYGKGDLFHEAGYDAYVTGCCFAKMTGYLTFAELEKHKNILYAYRAPYRFNISGDEILTENTILFVGTLAEGKRKEDLIESVKNYKENIYIRVVNDEIVFIGIKKREGMKEAILKLKTLSSIIKLEEWSNYVKTKRLKIIEERKKEEEKKAMPKKDLPQERLSLPSTEQEESSFQLTSTSTIPPQYQIAYAQNPFFNYYVFSPMPQFPVQYPHYMPHSPY